MKKTFLSLMLIAATAFASTAQIPFFPNNAGATLVNKTYDGNNQLVATTTYVVANSYDYEPGDAGVDLNFTVEDPSGKVLEKGMVSGYYKGNQFYLDMSNRLLLPQTWDMLSGETQIMGSFLDYPDAFNEDLLQPEPFAMTEGAFTLRSVESKRNYISVQVADRVLGAKEMITTPAGEFTASKITFNIKVYSSMSGETIEYKGIEWYAPRVGIVRSEVRDQNGILLNYTVLTEAREK